MIRITSKTDGFIRCGIRHPAKPTDHPEGSFTEDEMEILQAEPMLMIQVVDAPLEDEGGDDDPGPSDEEIAAAKAKEDADEQEKAIQKARQDAIEFSKNNNRKIIFDEAWFRSMKFDEAQKIAKEYYGVEERSWNGLWTEFKKAQDQYEKDNPVKE